METKKMRRSSYNQGPLLFLAKQTFIESTTLVISKETGPKTRPINDLGHQAFMETKKMQRSSYN